MKKLLPITVGILLIYLYVTPSVYAALKTEPVRRVPILERGRYDTDILTGSAGYSYSIPVPKGTNELTPEVSLDYNSSAVRDKAISTGIGWQIRKDYIERDVNYTPGSTGDDKFKLFLKGSMYDLVASGSGTYHTKTESFMRIKKHTGGDNTGNEYWEVTTPDGTKYRFGYQTQSELACTGRSYILAWDLDLVTDTHNNKIYNTYTTTNGVHYLTKIEYNNEKQRIIDFTYTTSSYQRPVYYQGCLISDTSRLTNIKVKNGSNLVRQFDLAYGSTGSFQPKLNSITEKGSASGSALPATSFTYKPQVTGWNTSAQSWLTNADIDAHLNSTHVTLEDVNGDALPDIIASYIDGCDNTWKVYLNTGTTWDTDEELWVDDDCIEASLNSANTRLIDVTGDGLPDIVRAQGTWKVYRNTGSNWDTTAETWASNGALGTDLTDSRTTIIDVNGDGLSDVVTSYIDGGSNVSWRVHINTGSNFTTSGVLWVDNSNISVRLDHSDVRLLDANGDGLPDIVKTTNSGSNATWVVYKNTGSSWNTTPETWINNANIDAYLGKDNSTVADVNNDGLIDIVRVIDNGTMDEWDVLLNKGNSWETTWTKWIQGSANLDIDLAPEADVRLLDVNGDGLTDIVKTSDNGGLSTWRVWVSNSHAPDLLASVQTSAGGTVTFDYVSSSTFDNTGADSLSDLRFPMWVVDEKTENNGMENSHETHDVTTYSYAGGLYDHEDREFRGFSDVTAIEPCEAKKQYVFHQSDQLKGRMASVLTSDTGDDPFAKTEQTWSHATANGITTVKLTKVNEYTYDGTLSNPKITETEFLYDSYGNVSKLSEEGDTSVGTDDRFTYTEFTVNIPDWIVNTPKKTYRNASNDSTKVSETLFYYDGNTGLDDAPIDGDLTKEEKWLSGGTNPVTLYDYDSYGNVIEITDPKAEVTTYSFGTNDTTHTYPDSMTNAKNQTTEYEYDLGTGNLLSKTDPNGFVTTYEYDVFGRVKKEIKPYDTNTYPTTEYVYLNDGVAPEGILVAKRETGSSSATLNMFTYTDGLGRTIQTRRDAEDTTKQIVTDTFYDHEGVVLKESVPYIASSSAPLTLPTPTPPPATKFGDGSDGDLTVSVNTTDAPIDSAVTASASSTTAAVSEGLSIYPNQIVLFHQTQGTNAGNWEFARVVSYSGSTLTVTAGLTNSYSSSGSNRAQVLVVPQYNDVTVNSGVTWAAKNWNGTTGGILTFLANGTVTVTGTITAQGKGFRGGTATTVPSVVSQGEGTSGTGSESTSANGNGGGGASSRSGGGGGGHVASGNNGTQGNDGGGTPGTGGGTAGTSDLSTMVFGGAGGGGGTWSNSTTDVRGGGGANAGGIVLISGANITVSGTVNASGFNGSNAVGSDGGGGGAGAGGSVLLRTQTATLGSSLMTAQGATGGTGDGPGNGGNSSNGRIRIVYETSLSGTTTPSASTVNTTVSQIPAGTVDADPPITAYGTYGTPDPSAKFTEYTYDILARVTEVENPKGDTREVAYDHWVVTKTNEREKVTKDYLNAFEKVIKVEEFIDASPSATLYEYNARDDLTKITDAEENEFTFTYDTLSRKTSQTDPDMGTWDYGYDANGNLTSQIDNRDITVTRTYDELNRVTGVNYPTDTDITYTYDGNSKVGTLTSVTDAAGSITYTYDNRLRKLSEARTVGATTKTTSYTYDAMDRVLTQTNPDSETVTYTYNNQGEVESVVGLVTDFDYNALGKITQKTFDNSLVTNYTYNTDDFRLNNITTGALQDLSYTYDAVGNISTRTNDLTSKVETFTYDNLDRLKTASESAGYNYAYDYNEIGNLTKFTDNGSETNYTYGEDAGPHALTSSTAGDDPTVNLALNQPAYASSIETSGLEAEKAFDGNMATRWASEFDDPEWVYVDLGSEKTIGRVVLRWEGAYSDEYEIQTSNDASTWSTIYSTSTGNGGVDDLTVSGSGRYVRMYGTSRATVWCHSLYEFEVYSGVAGMDEEELLSSPWQLTGNNGDDQEDLGIASDALNDVETVKVTFDLNGTSFGTGDDEASIIFIQDSTWFAANVIPYADNGHDGTQTVEIPITAFEEVGTSNVVDTEGTVSNLHTRFWNSGSFTVDITSVKLVKPVVQSPTGTELLSGPWTLTASNADDQEDQGIASDALEGMTNVRVTLDLNGTVFGSGDDEASIIFIQNSEWYAANVTLYGDNGLDGEQVIEIPLSQFQKVGDTELLDPESAVSNVHARFWNSGSFTVNISSIEVYGPGGGVYEYDANGNMVSNGTQCFDYNEANQLWRVTDCNVTVIAEYVYDYDGLRIIKKNYTAGTLANTVTSWTESYETKAIVGGGTEEQSYYYANKELVAKKKPNDDINFYHNDHLGSTSVLTDELGALVEETKYDPWGKVVAGGVESKFQYTGQEMDAETDLNYYNARYYNSDIRRFVQPDELIQDVYDPQTLNRYAYVRNNPLRYTDPSGKIFGVVVRAVQLAVRVATFIPVVQKSAENPAVRNAATSAMTSVRSAGTMAANTAKSVVSTIGNSIKSGGTSSATNFSHQPRNIPNPYGRAGGPAHQKTVNGVIQKLESQGFKTTKEFKIETPGGHKQNRFGDVYGISQDGREVIYQVGRQTKSGSEVSRERKAIEDIVNHGLQKFDDVYFEPYN